jgi:dienelactone hydrolase
LFARYLLDAEPPAAIAQQDPTLGAVWSRVVGTSPTAHYGRPFAFHQQAQRADWAAAWSRVNAPVLAMYGEYDWFESRDATQLIARIANTRKSGQGTYVEMPRMNHHFDVFASADAAFKESNGRVAADEAVRKMLEWLRQTLAGPSRAQS